MTTIEAGATLVTLINVFTVAPERQRALVEVLTKATDEVIQHVPGFVSANIHASADGVRVINYAQWESAEAYQAMLADPVTKQHIGPAAALAEHFDPHLFSVESVHHR